MCGICGFFNHRSGHRADARVLEAMNARLVHRGPDDEGQYRDGQVGIAMRRLSIIDLAGGRQPMSNEDGSVWIVFNGEIYNFPVLRDELEARGHRFKTRSDTETVIHAYEEWGIDALQRLNGMFGLSLWDARTGEMVLARDPFGVKPLYYAETPGAFLFASEVKALLAHPDVRAEVNLDALDLYLTLTFVPSPHTMFQGIRKLPPGHALRVKRGSVRVERFSSGRNAAGPRCEREWLELLQTALEEAVRRQMTADVPVGAMLSGGMDSATVTALMSRYSDRPVHSFTVGFAGGFKQDELAAARRSAKILGTEHHDVALTLEDAVRFLPESLWHLEEPIATPSTFAFYSVCRLARQYVKVVLTGQGADEPFAGYPRHLGEYYGRYYRLVPAAIRNNVLAPLARALPRHEQVRRAVNSLGIEDPLARMAGVYTIFDEDLKRALYRPEFTSGAKSSLNTLIGRWQSDVADRDGLSQMLYVDARFSLADNLLLYGDKMSMAASLEARVPFLDLELMHLVESMPPGLKIKGWTQKYLLKQAAAKWIPPEIVNRRKIGFATPVDGWFRHELRGYISDHLLSPGSGCDTHFRVATIEGMINDHALGRRDYRRALFILLTFELWYRQFIKPGHPM